MIAAEQIVLLIGSISIISIIIGTARWLRYQRRGIHVTALYIYPIKSCAGIRINCGTITRLGFEFDRRWLFVYKKTGRFITAREYPKLALIQPSIDAKAQTLSFTAPGMRRVTVPIQPAADCPSMQVTVWDDQINATQYTDPAISEFIRSFLGIRDVALVTVLNGNLNDHERPLDPEFDPNETNKRIQTGFADGFPFLLANEKSLNALNKLTTKRRTPMLAFRPNIIISGAPIREWQEDSWRSITINNQVFDVVKPCSRCAMPNVHPESGEYDEHQEPTLTLRQYRAQVPDEPEAVYFGQNIVQRQIGGTLRVADRIEIISTKTVFIEKQNLQ